MLDDLVRLGTNCARMARFMIGSLKFRADILYNVYREMRRTYRALIATAAQSMGIDDAAITREERQMSRHGADDQCGAVIAYWATYYLSRNWQCSFCGASGVVDTRGRAPGRERPGSRGAPIFFAMRKSRLLSRTFTARVLCISPSTYPRGCPRCKYNCRTACKPRGEYCRRIRSCTPAQNCPGGCRTQIC